ncbi:mechanosensitive ion channel family protein [Roseivirga sp. BDSF3-8]|uniref:mechanosensitive ion channel family protein n=1 Tax=Roseivirga sp. BDSF3-8 TaxID=3241598 RepID=UPI003531F52B
MIDEVLTAGLIPVIRQNGQGEAEQFTFNLSRGYDLILEKLEGWAEGLVSMLPNFILAALILVVFWVIARLVKKGLHSLLIKLTHNHVITNLFSTIGYIGVLLVGVFVALGVLDLQKTVTSLLAGAGIIGLALGFAFQDIAANFISGIILSFKQPFGEGDVVLLDGHMGIVKNVSLRTTQMDTFQGQRVLVPNKIVFQNTIINYSRTGRRRIDLPIGVSYGDDLSKVEDVALNAIRNSELIEQDSDVQVSFKEFGSSSINFDLLVWIDYRRQPDFLKARSEVVKLIKKAFDDNNITIPWPIRTLDFNIKGGEKLSDMAINLKNATNGTGESKISDTES